MGIFARVGRIVRGIARERGMAPRLPGSDKQQLAKIAIKQYLDRTKAAGTPYRKIELGSWNEASPLLPIINFIEKEPNVRGVSSDVSGFLMLEFNSKIDRDSLIAVLSCCRFFGLEALHFRGVKTLQDRDLAYIEGLTNLRSLTLCSTNITDRGLIHLHNLGQLKELAVEGSHISQAGITELRQRQPQIRIA